MIDRPASLLNLLNYSDAERALFAADDAFV